MKPLLGWSLFNPARLSDAGGEGGRTSPCFPSYSLGPCSWKRQHLPCKPPSTFWTSFLKYMHITFQMQKSIISILYLYYIHNIPHRAQMFFLNGWWWWPLWQGLLGELLSQSREVHNNKPHPSLTPCVEYIVHHRLNLYFPQVGIQLFCFGFFSSPSLKPLYVLFEVLICSHQNCHMIIGVHMLLRWATQSSGQHINGWVWVIWNSQALQYGISHTHTASPPRSGLAHISF